MRWGRSPGVWVVLGAAVLGLLVAIAAYVLRSSGVDHTPGALLVIVSTALLAVAAGVLGAGVGPGWLRATLIVLSALDIAGTLAAGWFLHAWILVLLMAIAAAGWVVTLFQPHPGAAEATP